MPTPPTLPDRLARGGWPQGKATLVNPGKLQPPTPNNYGQPVVAGQRSELPGFAQTTPAAPGRQPMRWTKIGHLSQGRHESREPRLQGPRTF